ncbi:MAG: hypothetical protein PWQ37_94 [Candidatus Petromonas sp.]|nr:hypothetical protein [Candidatus Petromonas sp.]
MRGLHGKGAIISNVGDNTLSIVDLLKLDEVEKIHMRSWFGPHHIVYDLNSIHLYISNSYSSSISKYDMILDKMIDTIFVGSSPCHLALNTKNNTLYVANEDSNSISVVDAHNMSLQAQIPVGEMPHDIKLSIDGKRLFVSNLKENTLSIIDTLSNSKEKCIYVNQNPNHMVLSKTGDLLYIANTNFSSLRQGSLTVVNTESLKVEDKIEVGKTPMDIALHEVDGQKLFITDMELNLVHILDIKEKKIIDQIAVGIMPLGIKADSFNKYLLVTNIGDNTLSVIDIKTMHLIKNVKVGKEPTSIVFI